MADHDQRFKSLLREFFAEFFVLFFPQWAERLDFSMIEWLDKEVFTDPPEGQRRFLDLVAKLKTRQAIPAQRPGDPEGTIALVHVEIEHEDSVQPLRSRMYEYYEMLRRQYRLPVLPLALYLQVGLDGLGTDVYEEFFWEQRVLRFEYQYVGLPALDALEYVTRDNWLGVALAALMRIPSERKAWLKAEALRRLVGSSESDQRRFLLTECVQAYLPLEGPQREEYEQLLVSKPYEGVMKTEMTTFEKGEALGRQKGMDQGLRRMLQMLLENRFGPLTPVVRQRLDAVPSNKLEELGQALLHGKSLREMGLED
jgi:hypothetical protein